MAKLTYNLERLERCIFSLYDDVKTPDDILKSWDIDERVIDQAWGSLVVGYALVGGIPNCRVRMVDMFKWEVIVDPPVSDNFEPMWDLASEDEIEYITDGEDLCSFLLIFAIESGDPNQFITDNESLRYNP